MPHRLDESRRPSDPSEMGDPSGPGGPTTRGSLNIGHWIVVALGAAALTAAFGDLAARLFHLWMSKPDYSHGFVVPLVAIAYGYWHRRVLWDGWQSRQPVWVVAVGGSVLGVGFAMRIVGILGRALPVEGASLVLIAWGAICLLSGLRAAVRMIPACLFLLLMLPLPGGVLNPGRGMLQTLATHISVFAIQTLGLPAISRGNVIVLPQAEIGVAEACSGLRMIVAFTALVSAVTMFVDRRPIQRWILMLSIVPIAVLVNAWRVTVVSVATYYRPGSTETVHDWAGLLMMFLAVGMLWALLSFMDHLFVESKSEDSRPQRSGPSTPTPSRQPPLKTSPSTAT